MSRPTPNQRTRSGFKRVTMPPQTVYLVRHNDGIEKVHRTLEGARWTVADLGVDVQKGWELVGEDRWREKNSANTVWIEPRPLGG